MASKRSRRLSDSESDCEQFRSDDEDEESLFLPDPNISGRRFEYFYRNSHYICVQF